MKVVKFLLAVSIGLAIAIVFVYFGKSKPAPPCCSSAKLYMVLIDISASRPQDMLDDSENFLQRLVKKLSFGDGIVFLRMEEVGVKNPEVRPFEMPTEDEEQLEGTVNGVSSLLREKFKRDSDAPVTHTDIFTTLQLAGQSFNPSGVRKGVLVLLSDMLQSDGQFEMDEHSPHFKMPPPNWIDAQRKLGLLPQFNGACVLVVGANATTKHGAEVRQFWMDYFAATGATLARQNYLVTSPQIAGALC